MDPLETLAELIRERATPDRRPLLVGMAGSVAVGKSTAAAEVAARLDPLRVQIVSTDGFLLPNAVLAARGLSMRKGFPESYDAERLLRFLADVRSGQPADAPVYSQELYDVLPDRVHRVADVDVVVVEGVNALQPPYADSYDLTVYVDADEDDIIRWYVERFQALRADAVQREDSFFRVFADGDETEVAAIATMVWRSINGVNLHEHIEPTRDTADVVLRKGPDHRAVDLVVRST